MSDLKVVTRALKVGISVAEVETVDLIVPSINGNGEAFVALRRVLANVGLGVVWRLKTKHGINERQHEYLHQERRTEDMVLTATFEKNTKHGINERQHEYR